MADRGLRVELRQDAPVPLDVDFACAPGEVLAVFGPSGSGKTTILRSIAGLDQPALARVRIGETVWADTPGGVRLPPHRRAVGYVFQEYALFPHLDAAGNVAAALMHHPRRERRARAEALLRQVHLEGYAGRRPARLSGGERQRVALARALAREPAVLLLDEPFAAVDRTVRRRLQAEVDALRRTLDIPMVLVTHDFDDVVRLATHLLLLEAGRMQACGPLAEVMSRPDLVWLREAIGLGSVFDAAVGDVDRGRGLASLVFDGGRLLVPGRALAAGARVRVRVPAREVILARTRPDGLSLHNALAGRVESIHAEPDGDQAVVRVALGGVALLAEVTRDAVATLGLAPGAAIHALVKSVSVEVLQTTE